MSQQMVKTRASCSTQWTGLIPDPQWRVYQAVLDRARDLEIPFAVGGAFAVASYTGCWRNTKDLDLYVLPEDRERMIGVLNELGLADYFEKAPYDRWWIYRSYRDDTILDVIWAMANHRARIDQLWMSGPELEIRGSRVKILPVEAMLWDKLYILQRDRCDWPDVLNLLYNAGVDVDWEYLLCRIGEDLPLMAGALSVFRWISPDRAQALPPWIWQRLGLSPITPAATPDIERTRAALLDRRPWYGPGREGTNGAKC